MSERKPFLCRIGIHVSLCHQGGYREFWFCNDCGAEVDR